MTNAEGSGEGAQDGVLLIVHERYLEARPEGPFSIERFKLQASTVVRACAERGVSRLLVDLNPSTGYESLGTTERYEIATFAAQLVASRIAVAVFGRREQFDPQEFGASVARNRGTRLI